MNKLSYLFLIMFSVKYVLLYEDPDRIAGGKPAQVGQFPFFVQLLIGATKHKKIYILSNCGATLIHPKWILTAGQCFIVKANSTVPSAVFKKNLVQAVMGTNKRVLNFSDPSFTFKYVQKAYFHPKFSPVLETNGILWYDIAVALLREPIHFNNNIKLIRLPDKKTKTVLCSKGVIAGTGPVDFDGHTRDTVQFADVNSKTPTEVGFHNETLNATAFFSTAKVLQGHPMFGDSGGPFLCNYNTHPPIQYGVISVGLFDFESDTLYTKLESVDRHIDFIKSYVPIETIPRSHFVERHNSKESPSPQKAANAMKEKVSPVLFIVVIYIASFS